MPRIALPVACGCCGRRFNNRSVIRGSTQEICEFCYEEAGYENAHSDGHHEPLADGAINVLQIGCHICQGTDPHAGFAAPRGAAEGAGRVMSDTDDRLRGNAPVLPENPNRVKLTGMRLGVPAPKYVGEASVIKADNHVWGGHSNWVMVIPDGMTTRRWFWAEDVETLPVARQRRGRSA